MWFSNAHIYHYKTFNQQTFLEALETHALKTCPPHSRFIFGFHPVFEDVFTLDVTSFLYAAYAKEERILPRAVIQRFLNEKVKIIESEESRTIRRAEKKQMAEDIEFDLLPKAFCIQKSLPFLLDKRRQRLILNTSSKPRAEECVIFLMKALPELGLTPWQTKDSLATRFANWLQNPETLPSPFSLASDCQLFSPDNEKKQVTCRGYELPADEIIHLLKQGLVCKEISLIWQERIQLTLTLDLTLKRIVFLEYLANEWHETENMEQRESEDAKLALLGGELSILIDDLEKLTGVPQDVRSRENLVTL